MNRLGRSALMLAIGVIVGRLLWSGGFGWFVQQRMRWPLIAATVVLLVFGLYEAAVGTRDERVDPSSVRRAVGPAIGWMLVLPILVLTSVEPTSLGASAADRVDAFTPIDTASTFAPIDDTSGPVEMRIFEFLERAIWDDNRSLADTAVRLEGLVVHDPDRPDGFLLTRFMVSCCAADGIPLQVFVAGGPELEEDTWVVADVVWSEPDPPYQQQPKPWVVSADAVAIEAVPNAPNDPYESPY